MNSAQRDARLITHYIRAFDLVAVYCAKADRSGITLIGRCRNLKALQNRLQSEHGPLTFYRVWWVSDAAKADRILQRVPHSGASAAAAAVAEAAKRERIVLTTDDEVRRRASAGISAVRAAMAGEMRSLNQAYRTERLARSKTGRKIVPYSEFVRRHEAKMIYLSAFHLTSHRQQRLPRL